MYNINKKKPQKIGIFGLGKTGESVFEYFKEHTNNIICYDDSSASRQTFEDKYGAEFICDLQIKDWQFLDYIVVSPGLASSHEIFTIADKFNIPIVSDIDIFYEENKDSLFVTVTGTNGKSTSASLIADILESNNLDFALGGNIGIPILSLPKHKKIYVLELSSFQLDLIKVFRADIAVLLNITPDHLDRYHTMENYLNSKKKIFSLINCKIGKPCSAIICVDHANLQSIYENLKHAGTLPVIRISTEQKIEGGITCLPGIIEDNINALNQTTYTQNNNLQGTHNRENIAASFAVCKLLGLDSTKITNSIENFKSLPHRMQYLGDTNNLHFYNDSKATNADSSSMALKSLDNIYWLAGGVLKEGGIATLEPYFKNIKKAYFYGSNKQIFAKQFKEFGEFTICENLPEAFAKATYEALENPTDTNILLSPASSSYDQYKNFEERGEQFIELYKQFKQSYDKTQTT